MESDSNSFQTKYPRDEVHWYFNELASRVVAESGIASDRHHIGKILLKIFKDNPNVISQIDGAIDKSYTNRDILERTVKCAAAFRKIGVRPQDVVLMQAPHHLDLAIPYYASFYIGAIATPISMKSNIDDYVRIFTMTMPKIIFCQCKKTDEIQQALTMAKLEARIITFDVGEKYMRFSDFLNIFEGHESFIDDFRASDFDPAEAIAILVTTGGSTGKSKMSAITHKNAIIGFLNRWINSTKFPTPTRLIINIGQPPYLSSQSNLIIGPIFMVPLLRTSVTMTQDHFHHLLRTYKPTWMSINGHIITELLGPSNNDTRDLCCFETITIGGTMVTKELIHKIKRITPTTKVAVSYGMSEASSYMFFKVEGPTESVGRPSPCFEYKLVDPDTQEIINEPNRKGELWLRGPSIFKGYYNQPERTAQAFTADGWFKTGDMLYRDQNWNFFFYDRINFLLKDGYDYVSVTKIENVIRLHPSIHNVVVTEISVSGAGDLLVAFVQPYPGCNIKAKEIKDLLKRTLFQYESGTRQDSSGVIKTFPAADYLRGVVFVSKLPVGPSGKVDREKLKTMIEDFELV